MSFNDLPEQSPIFPVEAETYAKESLRKSREAQELCSPTIDIAYGEDYWQKVDVYTPAGTTGGCPVVVFAHGGAWTHGYKEWMGLMAPPLLCEGIVFVSVSYRLAPDTKHPGPMEDCAAALGWVIKNIAEYGGDPRRVLVGGHSAGGHLYALAVLRRSLLERFEVPSDSLVACAPLSAQMDLQFPQLPPDSAEERVHRMLLSNSREAADASPIEFVHSGMPYMLLSYGSADFPRIIRGYDSMAAKMDENDCRYERLILAGRGHFDTALGLEDPENLWTKRVVSLLRG